MWLNFLFAVLLKHTFYLCTGIKIVWNFAQNIVCDYLYYKLIDEFHYQNDVTNDKIKQ